MREFFGKTSTAFAVDSFREILILSILFLLPFYFIKFKYNWVSLNLVEILILALMAVWIWGNWPARIAMRESSRLRSVAGGGDWGNHRDWEKYQLPAIFILVGVIFSIFINKNYYAGFGILKGWFLLPMAFAFILYDSLKKNEKLLNKIFIILFASGVLVAIEGLYYWLFGLLTYDGRLRIFYDSPNQLAMFLAPALLIGMVKFGFEEPFPSRREGGKGRTLKNSWELLLTGVGIILIALNLYLTKSYGAWLAIIATLGVVFWLKYRKILQRKTIILFTATLLIFVVLMGTGKYESIKKLGDRSSLASRVMIWKSAALMLESNPLFGIGPGNFQGKYLEYQKYFPPYLEWAVPQPHNLFLAFWLEAGLIGLIGFILLLVQFFRDNKKVYPFTKTGGNHAALVYKTKKQTQRSLSKENNFGDGVRGLYGAICLAIILYFLIHGLVDTTYWRNDMAVFFWMIIATNLFLAEPLDSSQRSR